MYSCSPTSHNCFTSLHISPGWWFNQSVWTVVAWKDRCNRQSEAEVEEGKKEHIVILLPTSRFTIEKSLDKNPITEIGSICLTCASQVRYDILIYSSHASLVCTRDLPFNLICKFDWVFRSQSVIKVTSCLVVTAHCKVMESFSLTANPRQYEKFNQGRSCSTFRRDIIIVRAFPRKIHHRLNSLRCKHQENYNNVRKGKKTLNAEA